MQTTRFLCALVALFLATGPAAAQSMDERINQIFADYTGWYVGFIFAPLPGTNFSWIALGDRDEAEIVAGLGRAGVIVRPGAPLGGPGHIRVTYGTAAENQRFLEALRPLV